MSANATPKTPWLQTPWAMLWVGLSIRVLYIIAAHTYRIRPFDTYFNFGWEMGRVGRALATGYGFSDPFQGHTGPTAWFPPLYPLLIGGVFKLFGVYTKLSAFALFTVNSIFSAATAPAVYRIGLRSFNRRVALWSGWLWALYPAAMQYATHWIWDMAVTTCLFAWVIAIALKARGIGEQEPGKSTQTFRLWAVFGLLWAGIALLNSSLLLFLPFCGLWMAWPERRRLIPAIARATLAAIIFLACLFPWTLRNYHVFHTLVPLRANFGAELYAGSLESNGGFPYGPSVAVYEAAPDMKRYKNLGEIAFSHERLGMAKAIIHAYPDRFRNYTLKRIWFYWAGVPHPIEKSLLAEVIREINYCVISVSGVLGLALALHRRRPGAILFAAAFFFLPLTYYIVTVQARFRAPLEPILCVLSVYLFQSADRSRTWSWQQPKDATR
ncbi:MAG TPA: glycosyltransferase family 39 protein [Granulicella sp.]